MSDPNLQRADGCSIFATLIVALLLVPAFYFIQKLFEADTAPSVTQDITDQRLKKIKVYLDETSQFNQQVRVVTRYTIYKWLRHRGLRDERIGGPRAYSIALGIAVLRPVS